MNDLGPAERERAEFTRMLEDGEIDGTTVLGVTVGSEALYREDATIDQNQNFAVVPVVIISSR